LKSNKKNAPPSRLDAHLGFWLRFVSNQVSARFQSVVEEEECSVTEWVALRVLFDQAATSHNTLIEALGMTKGATSKVISRLEARGLVKRVLAEGSNREQLIMLTLTGKKLVPRLAALADENDAYFFKVLSQAERSAFTTALKKLVEVHNLPGPPIN
jgi:DNA-binding MarR family transcriptional regulator